MGCYHRFHISCGGSIFDRSQFWRLLTRGLRGSPPGGVFALNLLVLGAALGSRAGLAKAELAAGAGRRWAGVRGPSKAPQRHLADSLVTRHPSSAKKGIVIVLEGNLKCSFYCC